MWLGARRSKLILEGSGCVGQEDMVHHFLPHLEMSLILTSSCASGRQQRDCSHRGPHRKAVFECRAVHRCPYYAGLPCTVLLFVRVGGI